MLTKRIVPCLDIKDGRVVKGVQFTGLRDAGDPVELARYYASEGADEICFLDITASSEKRDIVLDLVSRVAQEIFIPFTVGGGLRTIEDIHSILQAGADKVSLNTAAFQKPELIRESAERFGSQCIVCAIDAKHVTLSVSSTQADFDHEKDTDGFEVYLHGGRTSTGKCVVEWAQEAVSLGAGEILLTSMDEDGVGKGYNLKLIQTVRERVPVPIIASGGAGELSHFYEAVHEANADAVLAASVFHFGTYSIIQVKQFLLQSGISVRV